MSTIEGLKPVSGDHNPTDPNVRVPDHITRAAEQADAIHRAAYGQPEAPQAEPAPAEPAPVQQAQPTPQEPQQSDNFTAPADQQSLHESEWARRYNSMRGRFEASERSRAGMEQQMQELGQELVRTQNLVAQMQGAPQQQPQNNQPRTSNHGNLITEEDRTAYGDELLDVVRRTALSTISPELEALRAENQRLTERVQHTGKRELFATLDARQPNWRAINRDPRFINWLRLPNIYTGQIRQDMLKAAVDGAEAPKVLALFKDFLAEAMATGLIAPPAQNEQPTPQPAPHEPALRLDALAAPGRARPASGDSQVPTEKPTYSRADISQYFRDKQRGLYAGREAQAAAFEADLTAAQREGRIR